MYIACSGFTQRLQPTVPNTCLQDATGNLDSASLWRGTLLASYFRTARGRNTWEIS